MKMVARPIRTSLNWKTSASSRRPVSEGTMASRTYIVPSTTTRSPAEKLNNERLKAYTGVTRVSAQSGSWRSIRRWRITIIAHNLASPFSG
ncbi:hypothetical protein D3C72_1110400 [compost metagenome]